MALYFFDTRDGDELTEDDLGLDYTGVDAVRAEAAKSLAELANDADFMDGTRVLAVEVRDEAGPVLKVTMTVEFVSQRAA